jgi:ankyrin repeat protein
MKTLHIQRYLIYIFLVNIIIFNNFLYSQNKLLSEQLMESIRNGKYDISLALVEAGADVNVKQSIRFGWTGYERISPLMYLSSQDIITPNMKIVAEQLLKALIKAGADLNVRNKAGETPLILAARTKTGYAKILIDAGADINAVDNNYQTPLVAAVNERNLDVVKDLIIKGVDINSSKYALNNASSMSSNNILDLLIKNGFKLNVIGGRGFTAYNSASYFHNFDGIEMLLNAGADVNIKNEDGDSGIMSIAGMATEELTHRVIEKKWFNLLLKALNSNYNANCLEGDKLLKYFIRFDHTVGQLYCINDLLNILSVLIKRNVNINGVENDFTPLMIAVQHRRFEIAQLLIKDGANVNIVYARKTYNQEVIHNETALNIAVDKGFSEIVKILLIAGAVQ